jgi:hypothetical protein
MERTAIILWWTKFVSILHLSRRSGTCKAGFWYLLEGNGFFRALLAARGSYCGRPSPDEGAIESDELFSSSSRGEIEDDEARRICKYNARRQGRHIGHDGRMKDRPISANAMVSNSDDVSNGPSQSDRRKGPSFGGWSVLWLKGVFLVPLAPPPPHSRGGLECELSLPFC